MSQWQLRAPQTETEWQDYYRLRWQVLRAPWQQPPGSEQDELEHQAIHLMLINAEGDIAAAGRLHSLGEGRAQIRYMAVAPECQGKGLGKQVLYGLERQAIAEGWNTIMLNARESAQAFYKAQGYRIIGQAATLFGIEHVQMQKTLKLSGLEDEYQQWCGQLAQTWQNTIPMSQFMQLQISRFDGYSLVCQAPLAPNINLHGTMFAGSIYTLATLTGWGLLYLQLQAMGATGDQVLAEASIRYLRPVTGQPEARCYLAHAVGDLAPLHRNKRARQQIKVEIWSEQQLAAEFDGLYVVLPA